MVTLRRRIVILSVFNSSSLRLPIYFFFGAAYRQVGQSTFVVDQVVDTFLQGVEGNKSVYPHGLGAGLSLDGGIPPIVKDRIGGAARVSPVPL